MMYKAIDIARWFIQRNELAKMQGGSDMTLLKLLKLLYYAEGCALGLERGSLFNENIVAWEHGPVVEEVWRAYNDDPYHLKFGSDEDLESVSKINDEDKDLLEQVFQVFGQYSAWGLRNKTHTELPWTEATKHGTYLNGVISRATMKEYFKQHYVVD